MYDDLDGTEGASSVTFAYRGIGYEIDLSEQNQARLGAALAPFIVAARKTGRLPVPADGRTSGRSASTRRDVVAIRSWAREHGFEVPDRAVSSPKHRGSLVATSNWRSSNELTIRAVSPTAPNLVGGWVILSQRRGCGT